MEQTSSPASAGEIAEVTAEDLIARSFQTEPPKVEETKEPQPEPDEPEEKPEETSEIVLSQEYLDSLDEDRKQELASWASRELGKDMGKLRERARDAESREAEWKAKYEEVLANFVPKSDNPFSDLTSEKAVSEKEKELKGGIDYFLKLERSGNWQTNDNGDEGYIQDGKFYSKDQVMSTVDQWIDQLPKLTEQRYRLREHDTIGSVKKAAQERAAAEFPWLQDKESEQTKEYNKRMSQFKVITDVSPKLEAELTYLMAHAVNSMSKPAPSSIRLPKSGTPARVGDTATGTATIERDGVPKSHKERLARIQSGKYSQGDVINALIAPSFT